MVDGGSPDRRKTAGLYINSGGTRKHAAGTRLRSLALAAATLIVLLVVAEVAARMFYHPPNLGKIIQFDPVLGWSLRPSSHLHCVDHTRHFDYRIAINSLGMRNDEITPQGDPGRKRILVTGDSFVFGTGNDQRWRFSDIMGRVLSDEAQVINVGVAGWGTDQELLHFERIGRSLKPDIVILTMMMANDVVNNMLDHLFLASAPKPRFTLRGDSLVLVGNLDERAHRPRRRIRDLAVRSRFLVFVKRRFDRLRHRPSAKKYGVAAESGVEEEWRPGYPSHWTVFQREYPEEFETAWGATEAMLLRFAELCREDDIHLLVFAFPLKFEVDDEWRSRLCRRTGQPETSLDATKPYRRLSRFCLSHDIDFIYPLGAFREATTGHRQYFDVDGHPNRWGNATAARCLLDALHERGLVRADGRALSVATGVTE